MSEVTIRQLDYFLAVVDHGSISAASRHVHISQAAVSMAIRQLEKTLNASLLIRGASQRAAPTPAGEVLIPHARKVVNALREARDAVLDDLSEMRGTLRIAIAPTISPYAIPPLIHHFQQEHPQVTIHVEEFQPFEIHDAVRKDKVDLGIVYHLSLQEGFPFEVITEVQQHVALSAQHPLADQSSIHLAEIIDEPLIPISMPPSIERITDAIKALGLHPRIQWPSQNYETVRSMVAYGLGWSYLNLVPETKVTYDGGEIRYIPIADSMPYNAVIGITHPDLKPDARVTAALEYLSIQH